MQNRKKTIETIVIVVLLTFFAKFIGFFREALLGSKIGANMASDAYIMAFNTTSITFVSIGTAITITAIPLIVEQLAEKGKTETFRFVNNLLNLLILLSTTVVGVGMLFTKQIMAVIARGFGPEKMTLTVELTKVMFPTLICICITYVFVSVLQSLGRFRVTSFISFPANLLAVLFLYFLSETYGVKGLAMVTLLGWVLQFLIQLPSLWKEGFRFRIGMNWKDPAVKRFFKIIVPVMVVASVSQMNMLLDEMQASSLVHGSVSSLYYANMLYIAITTITVYGISTVMFPKFAEKATKMSRIQYGRFVFSIVQLMVFILLPMSTGILLLKEPIIQLIFGRGAFTGHTVDTTAMALAFYALGMVGFGIQDVVNKACYALEDTKSPTKFAIFTILLNVMLNIILVRYYDVIGIAMATALATLLGAFGLLKSFKDKIPDMDMQIFWTGLIKTLWSCVVMAAVVYGITKFLGLYFTVPSLRNKILRVMIPSFAGAILYGVMTVKLKIQEAVEIYNDFLKPFKRKVGF